MDDQDLRKLLEQLHSEIEHTETVDAKGSELLRDISVDIRELIERSENEQVQPQPSTLQALADTISHLEATHPTITSTLSKLLETLSNAGI